QRMVRPLCVMSHAPNSAPLRLCSEERKREKRNRRWTQMNADKDSGICVHRRESAVRESVHDVCSGLTTQAQRPGARDATMATATPPPGSLQRMVRPRCHDDDETHKYK